MKALKPLACVLYARRGSKGVPGKNRALYGEHKSYAIVLDAALKSGGDVFVCTDDEEIELYAREKGIGCIPRPQELSDDDAHLEKVIHYTYQKVLKDYELTTILMGNAPFVTADLITASVEKLNANSDLDSVISVSAFPMFAPERARRIEGERVLPYLPNMENASCDRSSHKNCYFSNGALTTVHSHCLADMSLNQAPMRWMGKNIGHIEQASGLGDIDDRWQIPVTEWWLKENSNVHG